MKNQHMEEIKYKVQEELNNGNWKLVVNCYDKEASISFKSDWLNMLEVEVVMSYEATTNEKYHICSFNGMSFKEDMSEIEIELYQYLLKYNGTEHSLDLSSFEDTFSEIIADYHNPHE